ncbi:MAG: adenosylcobinamide-GDP ribazoletransferase [Planctomycetota bacterium]
MRLFKIAMRFLTVFPVEVKDPTAEDLGRSVAWFPVVGAFLGVMTSFIYFLLLMGFGAPLADAGAVLALVIFTGALHLDGLADTFDGLLGGVSPGERLAIMRDRHHGTYGVVAIAGVLLLKAAALAALPLPAEHQPFYAALSEERRAALAGGLSGGEILLREKILLIFLMPVLARWGMVLAAGMSSYARSGGGLGREVVERTGAWAVIAATVVPAALCVGLLGRVGIALLAVMAFLAFLVSLRIRDRVGGMTGDTLGAVVELLEPAVPLAFLAVTGIWRAYVFPY